MAIPIKKYGYTINPITDEIKTPQVFLVNKRLQKVGELYPVENLSIKVNEVNQPDEASFTYHKEKNGETVSSTGTETESETGTIKRERFGNIGVTTSQQMLQSELDLWKNWDFVEQVYKDVDTVLTCPLYE